MGGSRAVISKEGSRPFLFQALGPKYRDLCIGVDIDTNSPKKGLDFLKEIDKLIKALNSGAYNAKPSTLHQCKQDGSCGCWGPVDGVKFDPDGTVTLSYKIKLAHPISFIPLTFYLDGV